MAGSYTLTSNVFEANLKFDSAIGPFDFYRVDGVPVSKERYVLLGKAVRCVQSGEKKSFAQYTPSPNDNLIVGFLPSGPSKTVYETDGLVIKYEGKNSISPTPATRRTLTDLLNKSKSRELRNILWSPGAHCFYPKQGENLESKYNGCNLTLFRGPFFRYNVLSNGAITLALDSSTHYVRTTPFHVALRSRGVRWFLEELDRARRREESRGKTFTGLHFFYELYSNDVAIDGIDKRPISQIPLSKPQVINGVFCRTIAEYLRQRYKNHPKIADLDETQPGLKGGTLTYAPQFLYQTAQLSTIPRYVKVEQTFYMENLPARQRDNQKPAASRWELIRDYFYKYNFQYVDLGPAQLKMSGPLNYPITNHFEKPLLRAAAQRPVPPSEIEDALMSGMYRPPRIGNIFLYSQADKALTNEFYERMWQTAVQQTKLHELRPTMVLKSVTELLPVLNST